MILKVEDALKLFRRTPTCRNGPPERNGQAVQAEGYIPRLLICEITLRYSAATPAVGQVVACAKDMPPLSPSLKLR